MAQTSQFRQDLLYRINTVEILIPSLRERKEDINLIADYYLELFSDQYGKGVINLREDAMNKLKEYHWPGNIRELAHAIERAVILCKNGILTPEDFVLRARSSSSQQIHESEISVEEYENKAIKKAMSKHNGNLSKAAEEMGMARSTLYRKIARFGMES